MKKVNYVVLEETVDLVKLREEVQRINVAKEEGVSEDKIQGLLKLEKAPSEILADFEKFNIYCTVEEALERINKETKRNITMKRPTILKLINDGIIKAARGPKRHGFFIFKDSLEQYIAEQNLTKEDLMEQLKKAQERIAELEALLEGKAPEGEKSQPKTSGRGKGSKKTEVTGNVSKS